jgi:hypothetical protein
MNNVVKDAIKFLCMTTVSIYIMVSNCSNRSRDTLPVTVASEKKIDPIILSFIKT